MLYDFAYVNTRVTPLFVRSARSTESEVLSELKRGTLVKVSQSFQNIRHDCQPTNGRWHWTELIAEADLDKRRWVSQREKGWVAAECLKYAVAEAYVIAPDDGHPPHVVATPHRHHVSHLQPTPCGQDFLQCSWDDWVVPVFSSPIQSEGSNVEWVEVGLDHYVDRAYLVYKEYTARVKADGAEVYTQDYMGNYQWIGTLAAGDLVGVFGCQINLDSVLWSIIGPNCYVNSVHLEPLQPRVTADPFSVG